MRDLELLALRAVPVAAWSAVYLPGAAAAIRVTSDCIRGSQLLVLHFGTRALRLPKAPSREW